MRRNPTDMLEDEHRVIQRVVAVMAALAEDVHHRFEQLAAELRERLQGSQAQYLPVEPGQPWSR